MNLIKIFFKYSFIGRLALYMYYRFKFAIRKNNVNIMFGAVVNKSRLGSNVTIFPGCNISNSSIGDYSYVAQGGQVGRTHIGKYSCIGPNFLSGVGKHPSRDFVSIHPVFFSATPSTGEPYNTGDLFLEKEPINLGNDVWIGANVLVLDGVNIADGCIVAAGSVVTKNLPPYAIAGGVPCKIIRFRFTNDEIEKLINLKWWDKPQSWLSKNAIRFSSIDSL